MTQEELAKMNSRALEKMTKDAIGRLEFCLYDLDHEYSDDLVDGVVEYTMNNECRAIQTSAAAATVSPLCVCGGTDDDLFDALRGSVEEHYWLTIA